MSLINSVRKVLGVRRERALPLAGPKPRYGAKIYKGDIRMTVQAGLTDSTWRWLVDHGWREATYRNDRRMYRDIPPSLVAEFFDATDADDRAQLLMQAITEAAFRPTITLPQRR